MCSCTNHMVRIHLQSLECYSYFVENQRKTRRQLQASETRAVIVAAASRLFLRSGYVDTTVPAIAAEAGVAVQTIYNSVGNKASLLTAVLEATAAGPDAPTSVPEFMRARTSQAPDADAVLRVLADWFADVHPRTTELFRVIAQAAVVDADAAKVAVERARLRLEHYGEAAAILRERGALSSGMSDGQAAAAIWSIGHPEAYRSLVVDLGWTLPQYRDWVYVTLKAALA